MATKENKSPEPAETKPAEPVAKASYDWCSLNTLAVVSLASAITGIGAVMAIITGHISLAQIKRSKENGRALAITGVTLGYFSIAIWIIFAIAAVSLRAYMGSGSMGLQPFGHDFFEFQRGFGSMHWHD